MAISEKIDRIVTGSADMMGAQKSHVVQVWRLSDLKLMTTMVLPKSPAFDEDPPADSSEPRTLSDGTTVVVPTFGCALFIVNGLAGTHPTLTQVYDFGYRTCEVPVVVGKFFVMAAETGHELVSLDMTDPSHPRDAARMLLPPNEFPHWISMEPGGNRIVIAGFGALASHLRFATIDRDNGQMSLDPESIDLNRSWPDGWHGAAVPHGTVFSNN